MYPRAHAAISLVVSAGVVTVGDPTIHPGLAVVYGVAVGVLIDLDHFVLAWVLAGSLDPLARLLRAPWIVVTDPGSIFEADDLGPYHRLISHVVIAGGLVPLVWLAAGSLLGVLSAVVLWAHVLADLVADLRTYETVPRDGSV